MKQLADFPNTSSVSVSRGSVARMGVGSVLLSCVRLWLVWWDLATSWLYALLHPPAKLRAQHHAVRAVPCKPIAPGDTQVHTPVTSAAYDPSVSQSVFTLTHPY